MKDTILVEIDARRRFIVRHQREWANVLVEFTTDGHRWKLDDETGIAIPAVALPRLVDALSRREESAEVSADERAVALVDRMTGEPDSIAKPFELKRGDRVRDLDGKTSGTHGLLGTIDAIASKASRDGETYADVWWDKPEGGRFMNGRPVRRLARVPRFRVGDMVLTQAHPGPWRVRFAGRHHEGHMICTVEDPSSPGTEFFDVEENFRPVTEPGAALTEEQLDTPEHWLSDEALRLNVKNLVPCRPKYEANACRLRDMSAEILRLREELQKGCCDAIATAADASWEAAVEAAAKVVENHHHHNPESIYFASSKDHAQRIRLLTSKEVVAEALVDGEARRCQACEQVRSDVGELPDSLPLCVQCTRAHRMGYRCGEEVAALTLPKVPDSVEEICRWLTTGAAFRIVYEQVQKQGDSVAICRALVKAIRSGLLPAEARASTLPEPILDAVVPCEHPRTRHVASENRRVCLDCRREVKPATVEPVQHTVAGIWCVTIPADDYEKLRERPEPQNESKGGALVEDCVRMLREALRWTSWKKGPITAVHLFELRNALIEAGFSVAPISAPGAAAVNISRPTICGESARSGLPMHLNADLLLEVATVKGIDDPNNEGVCPTCLKLLRETRDRHVPKDSTAPETSGEHFAKAHRFLEPLSLGLKEFCEWKERIAALLARELHTATEPLRTNGRLNARALTEHCAKCSYPMGEHTVVGSFDNLVCPAEKKRLQGVVPIYPVDEDWVRAIATANTIPVQDTIARAFERYRHSGPLSEKERER